MFGKKARALFLVPGTLKAETGKYCQTAAGKAALTRTGTAAACLTQNDGTHIHITSPDSTFSTKCLQASHCGRRHVW
jgi:hypothetical protein